MFCFVSALTVVYADDTFAWYKNNKDILTQNSLIGGALRGVGWLIVTLVVKLCDGCQSLYDTAFNFLDVTKSEEINKYVEMFKPVVIALMALSLLYLGYTLMVEHEKKPKLMINICIVILCITSSASIFSTLNDWTLQFKDEISGGTPDTASMTVVQDNIVDLVYLYYNHDNGLEGVNWSAKEEYGTSATFDEIDYTEVLNPNSKVYENWKKGNTKKLLSNYYRSVPKEQTIAVENGFGWNSKDDADFGNTFYFRYKFNFLEALIQLFSLIIIYITMSYKVVRVAFELVVARLFAYLYSAELSGGEKIKKIFVFIRDSYILLVVTALCVRVYLFFSAWIGTQWNPLVRSLFLLFLAFAVIDGPNLVEKLLGMDAGLKSSTARMLAIGRAASGFGRAAGGVVAGASAKNVAQKVNNVKSGEISRGGIAAGAYGSIFGKAMTDGDAKTASTSERVGGLTGISKGEKQKRAIERESSGGWGGSSGFNSSSGGASQAPGSASQPSSSNSYGNRTSDSGGSYAYNAAQGSSGTQGQSGAQGSSGAQGQSGAQGSSSKGERGTDGQKGDSGQKGDKGDRGYHGVEGREGKAGEQGKEAPQKEAFSTKVDKAEKQNNPFEAKSEPSGRRSFMDQGYQNSPSSRNVNNGNNFMNGGGDNGNKNNDSKHRK